MRNWVKFKRLTSREKKLLLQALLLLPIVHFFLNSMGYARFVQIIVKRIPITDKSNPVPIKDQLNIAFEIAQMVSIAAYQGPFRATCLRRSLALIILLQRHGVTGELCFGARLHDQGLEAHAWVEKGGVVINDRPDIRQKYTPLDSGIPSTKAGL